MASARDTYVHTYILAIATASYISSYASLAKASITLNFPPLAAAAASIYLAIAIAQLLSSIQSALPSVELYLSFSFLPNMQATS